MSLVHIRWRNDGLCGAACAQMVLHARLLVGITKDEQSTIWEDIQSATEGSGGAACSKKAPEPFDNMIHETCTGSSMCWETFPTALKATLTDRFGGGTSVKLKQTASQDTANDIIRDSLDSGGVPIVLTQKGKHWVVVKKWNRSGSQPVKVLDPAKHGPSAFSVGYWNAFFMAAVECGTFDTKYVIVEVGQ